MIARNRWTKEEDAYLTEHWGATPIQEILDQLNRHTREGIRLRARSLGIRRDMRLTTTNIAKSKTFVGGVSGLPHLLDETPEAYYWAGFILADGHINTKVWRLVISLKKEDGAHLAKFCKFINCYGPFINPATGQAHFKAQDKIVLPEFASKFNITHRKSYELDIPSVQSVGLFMALFAGFVDGDGSIKRLHKRSDAHIRLVGHANSLPVFIELANKIYTLFPADRISRNISSGSMPKLDRRGYARWNISNSAVVREIAKYLKTLNLPLLERKWSNIDLTRKTKYEIAKERRCRFGALRKQGLSITEIALQLGVGVTTLYKYIK